MKPLSDYSDGGKVLILLGGALIAGTIISIKNKYSEEATRELLQSDQKEQDKIKLIEVSINPERKVLSGTPPETVSDSIYPPYYHTLSKGAKYRFRQKLKTQK